MKCEHCKSENLRENFIKSAKLQSNKTKRYFRYCKGCGHNSYYNFPSYLDESQFDKYIEQINQKGDYSGILED
jgi:hypothetical protein